jgi:nitric oxide synthase oxygenase domain/subunit
MHVFLARFSGHYLGAEILIIEETKRKAFNKAKKEIDSMGLSDKNIDFTIKDIESIDLNIKQVVLIDNGDY